MYEGAGGLDIPKHPREGELTQEFAAEEAALMQAFLDEIVEKEGSVLGGERPSAADYDNALEAVAEIRDAARAGEGTRDEKVVLMKRAFAKLGNLTDQVMDALLGARDTKTGERLRRDTEEHFRSIQDALTPAEERLRELRDRAYGMN